ncbi:histone deacetylase [Eudoraea chungangensis]|uniref:histone deacetylase family protein n=1 Tax=Eudoraea chungangensis TaxID=1481905 RepID=UPI0023EDC510
MLKIAYHPIYKLPLPEGHRFPMLKYDLLPKQLLFEGTCSQENFFEPLLPNKNLVLKVHSKEYFNNLIELHLTKKEVRKIGFPLDHLLVEREQIIADGTIKACDYALEYGIAMNIAGGTHHAYSNRGEAFCLLNDQAIAARYLQNEKKAKKILIIDLDVHQGNGTAEIFQNDSSVYTFSMHGANNYPFKKEVSDLDIALEKGTSDKEYLDILAKVLPNLINSIKPDFIFYLCGVDILSTDKLGTLAVSHEGCKKRDEIVISTCAKHGIPIQCSMGGGYSPRIKDIINAHANTFRIAQEVFF